MTNFAKSIIAGSCGSVTHLCFMWFKSWSGILPSFQPYNDLQHMLSVLVGSPIHPAVPWVLSFLNGAVVLGFLFGRTFSFIPGRSGVTKGVVFGLAAWVMMSLAFFPMLGRGIFAVKLGLGIAPAVLCLTMLLTYSVIMGLVYSSLNGQSSWSAMRKKGRPMLAS